MKQDVYVGATHVLLQLLEFLPGNSLPASNVENSVEVVALDEQAAEGEQRQLRVLPDLQVLQVLESVGGEDLLEGGVANVRRHSYHQLVQVEAGGEQEDEEVLRAGAGDGQLAQI